MEQMATSPLSNGDRTPKSSNRQQGPPVIAQGSQTQPPLNCPRCDSTNTKFCYFNNYSQTQPRHFCKSCRRYWTQGGTLRNVPIGGGCRKNKRVRPRSLLGMGGLDHGSAFTDTTSNMLGRLSSISSFGNGCEDTGSQLLNVAFARFQESMRVRQQAVQSAEGAPFPDMSLPALVHKPCGVSSCTGTACSNRASLHIDGTGCGGLRVDSFDNNLGFHALQAPETGYHPSNFEMTNSALYAHTHNMMGTSATATLASIEDELSSFSNFQYHLNPLSTEVSQEDKVFSLSACSASQRLLARPPLTEHGGSHLSYIESSLMGANADLSEALAEDEKPIKEEIKPIVSMHGENTLSLMMPADNNWQQQHQSPMSEILYSEPHHGMMWSANTSRWPDMHTASVP